MTKEEKRKAKLSNISIGKTINGQLIKKIYYYDDERLFCSLSCFSKI